MKVRSIRYRIMMVAVIAVLFGALTAGNIVFAAVSAEEAAKLKTTLTPFGGERAGNKEGTIPAWTGGYTTPQPDYKGEKRSDPFASDKPLFTITAQNMSQYADKLSDGDKALLKKYPEYHINVYQTRRTAAAPQWIYDEIFKNATRTQIENGMAKNCYGSTPFPIAKTGEEAIWNVNISWKGGAAWSVNQNTYLINANGQMTLISDSSTLMVSAGYADPNGSPEKWNGNYQNVIFVFSNPPTRNGEGIVLRDYVDHTKNVGYLYFPGQRRVRQIPTSCCDTPAAYASGMLNNDEIRVWYGYHGRYNWKIVGKKEMYVPYNENRMLVPTSDKEMVTGHVVNPDKRRYELHRVWVVEGNLKPGERHVAPRVVLYLDEDSWLVMEGERYDARGQLWHFGSTNPMVVPERPAVTTVNGFFGYDLVANYAVVSFACEKKDQLKFLEPRDAPDSMFTPEEMIRRCVR